MQTRAPPTTPLALALIRLTTLTTPEVPRDPTSRTSTPTSVTSPREAPTRQSRSCRRREGWQLSGSESFETCTLSSNTSEVGHPLLYSTFLLSQNQKKMPNRKKLWSWAADDCWPDAAHVFFLLHSLLPNSTHVIRVEFVELGLTAFLRSRPFRVDPPGQQAHV